jgi:hypothetical protein
MEIRLAAKRLTRVWLATEDYFSHWTYRAYNGMIVYADICYDITHFCGVDDCAEKYRIQYGD